MGTRTRYLTNRQREQIVQALQVGAPVRHACEAAGVPASTFNGWLIGGRTEILARANGDKPNKDHDDWVELVGEVETAIATGAVSQVVSIQRAANSGKWQAAAWLLARRHPEEWGPPEQRIQIAAVTEDLSPREGLVAELDRMDARLSLPSPDTDHGHNDTSI